MAQQMNDLQFVTYLEQTIRQNVNKVDKQELLKLIDDDIQYFEERIELLQSVRNFPDTTPDDMQTKIMDFYDHNVNKHNALISFRQQVAGWTDKDVTDESKINALIEKFRNNQRDKALTAKMNDEVIPTVDRKIRSRYEQVIEA